MNIIKKNKIVYYAPTRGRHFFSKRAAVSAEAKSLIYNYQPYEEADYDHTGRRLACTGWNIEHDEPERYKKLHGRLCRMLNRNIMIQK